MTTLAPLPTHPLRALMGIHLIFPRRLTPRPAPLPSATQKVKAANRQHGSKTAVERSRSVLVAGEAIRARTGRQPSRRPSTSARTIQATALWCGGFARRGRVGPSLSLRRRKSTSSRTRLSASSMSRPGVARCLSRPLRPLPAPCPGPLQPSARRTQKSGDRRNVLQNSPRLGLLYSWPWQRALPHALNDAQKTHKIGVADARAQQRNHEYSRSGMNSLRGEVL